MVLDGWLPYGAVGRRYLSIAVATGAALLAVGLAAAPAAPFADVAEDAWYAPAVAWLQETEITTGVRPGCFEPELPVTRAQAATFLYRLADPDPSTAPMPFVDVDADWAIEPVRWLAQEKITTGVAPDRFAPRDLVTRGQFAALLHRFDGAPDAAPHEFDDVVAAYQQQPISWMAAAGLTTGTGPGTFSPDRPISRAELAVFLHRYAGEPAAAADRSTPCRRTLVIHGVGDVNFDPGYGPNPQQPYSHAWTGLDGLFLRDDLTIMNLECAPSELGTPAPKSFTFRCPIAALEASAAAGVDVANLANNHGGDFGMEALVDGAANVAAAGMMPVGAGVDAAAATTPAVFDIDGTTVAILGFNAVATSWDATATGPGMAGAGVDQITAAVEDAAALADHVIVTIHWGAELYHAPLAADVQRAWAAIDAGADAVIGHGPHVLQPLVTYRDRPIFWSMGNFVWHTGTTKTAIARVSIHPDGSVTGELVPATIVEKGHPVVGG